MDERALTLIFLLMAGVLPLRELGAKWAGRPERRQLYQALVTLYLLTAVGAVIALAVVARREDAPRPSPAGGPGQIAMTASPCVERRARA